MKSALLALPSGRTVDLTNFVAIVPLQQTDSYQLLFTGLSQLLTLDPNDAAAVNTFLSTRTRATLSIEHSYSSIELTKPNALDLMTARVTEHQNLADEEDTQNAEAFERFKQLIDRDRPLSQKLYS